MSPPATHAPLRAVIFDLGDTLIDFPDWDGSAPLWWAAAYRALSKLRMSEDWGPEARFVQAMITAETEHWRRVEAEHSSGAPEQLVRAGMRSLGAEPQAREVAAVLDGYGSAVSGWARIYPDAVQTLTWLRHRGLKLGLLSNTWWAADWHNADLAGHGLASLLDAAVYTSDLPHSKPHPTVFLDVAARLGADPSECVMVGDRPIDDIRGALSAGMRAVWKTNGAPRPKPDDVVPTATVATLSELPPLIERWAAAKQ